MEAGDPRDKELPGSSPHEAKKLRQETRCANKWIKMLKRWDHYLPSEKLRRWVYKVVPPEVRGQVWLQLLNVQVKARNARKYQEMKEAALVSWGIMQIDLDVSRTFRSHTMFWDRYRVGEVGYCQGMSEIAAILLMFLPEKDAFWALAQLMTDNRHAMHRDEDQMSTRIYTPKWFPQCFLGRIPFSLTLKLWDVYTGWGVVLTAMAYTILKVHKKRLLKLPLEGLREFLQDSLAQPWALEDEAVLRHLRASMTQLQRMRCNLPPPPAGLRAPAPPDSACWGCPQGTEPPGPLSSSLGLSSPALASGTPGQGWACGHPLQGPGTSVGG
ncbi:USP6 N-terminal-like protein [Vulpes lagopus]